MAASHGEGIEPVCATSCRSRWGHLRPFCLLYALLALVLALPIAAPAADVQGGRSRGGGRFEPLPEPPQIRPAPSSSPSSRTIVVREQAVGFGGAAIGGQGKPFVDVVTLRDTPDGARPVPGSLRAALSGGDRTIRFRVSGNIELVNDLVVRYPNVTIDGSDAPNGGVALWSHSLRIETDNVVVRNLRFRGSHPTEQHDGLAIGGGKDILIDHVSCAWATDECISIYGYSYTGKGSVRRVTIQNSLIAEAPDGLANYGMLIDGDVSGVTLYRNVFAKNGNRNPQISTGQRRGLGGPGERLSGVGQYELVQNVVYDAIYSTRLWNQSPEWTMQLDVIGNLWKAGPHWARPKVPVAIMAKPRSTGPIQVYLADNLGPGNDGRPAARACDYFSLETANAPCAGYAGHSAPSRLIPDHEFPGRPAAEDLESILGGVGASLPCRDSLDAKVIAELRSGTGRHVRSPGRLPDLTRACQ